MKRKITSIKLLELFSLEKNQIQHSVREKTSEGPKKVQLSLILKQVKPKFDQASQKLVK